MYLPEIIIKSLKFDKIVYLDARDNPGFNKFSVLIVLLVGFCTGIGTYNLTNDTSIIYIIGVKIMKNSSSFSQLARTLGIAYSPGVLNVFGIIKFISLPLLAVILIWTIVSFIFALKHALNISAERAFLISVLSFIPYLIFRTLLFFI